MQPRPARWFRAIRGQTPLTGGANGEAAASPSVPGPLLRAGPNANSATHGHLTLSDGQTTPTRWGHHECPSYGQALLGESSKPLGRQRPSEELNASDGRSVVRVPEVLIAWILAADFAPVEPSATTPRVTQPAPFGDCRFESTVTIGALQPCAAACCGD